MKKLRTFRTLSDCDQVRLRLEAHGIASLIKNEYSANTVAPGPLGPLPFALPEIWLLDDTQMEAALDILGREPRRHDPPGG